MLMIKLSRNESLARLSNMAHIDTRFETKDSQVTSVNSFSKHEITQLLKKVQAYESGPCGQALDYGIYVEFVHKTRGNGLLFLKTRPECRASISELITSIEHGKGANTHAMALEKKKSTRRCGKRMRIGRKKYLTNENKKAS
jgi:hypothetical protein